MMKNLLLVCFCMAVLGCKPQRNAPSPTPGTVEQQAIDTLVVTPSSAKFEKQVQMDDFTLVNNDSVMAFPLGQPALTDTEKGGVVYKSYKERGSTFIWNVAFYNTYTNESYLLTPQKLLFTGLHFSLANSGDATLPNLTKWLVYECVEADFNGDKVWNEEDVTALYVSDASGKYFRKVSPILEDVQSWRYLPKLQAIILQCRNDSNKDKTLDEKDETNHYLVRLAGNSEPEKIFKSGFKYDLQKLYQQIWQGQPANSK